MTTTPEAMHDGIESDRVESQAADALEATAFTVPVERAAELFKHAGFPRSPDHISRWCRQGTLRATKQPTRNGLSRYLIEQRSIEEVLERLRREKHAREHPQVFEAMADTPTTRRHNGGTDDAAAMSPRHHDGTDDAGMPASVPPALYEWPSDREDAAEMRGELRALKEQARKDTSRIEKLENENGNLRISLGEYRGKADVLEKQLNLLTAPKPPEPMEPEPAPATPANDDTTAASMPAPTPTSWWRRFFGGS
jgi:hypothetical protein